MMDRLYLIVHARLIPVKCDHFTGVWLYQALKASQGLMRSLYSFPVAVEPLRASCCLIRNKIGLTQSSRHLMSPDPKILMHIGVKGDIEYRNILYGIWETQNETFVPSLIPRAKRGDEMMRSKTNAQKIGKWGCPDIYRAVGAFENRD